MSCFYGSVDVIFVAYGYRTPDGVGCRVGDLDGVLSLAFAPGAVDEVGGDVPVGDFDGVAGELLWGLRGHRSTAVFSRSRERFRSAWAISMAASVMSSGMISCSSRSV